MKLESIDFDYNGILKIGVKLQILHRITYLYKNKRRKILKDEKIKT